MRYGDELLTFSPEIDRDQIGEESLYNLATKRMGSLSASKNERRMRSRIVLDRIVKKTIIGKGECVGSPDIVPGRTIHLEGLGKRFTRNYQATGAIHTLDGNQGYRRTFSATTK